MLGTSGKFAFEPDHSQGYTRRIQKAIELSGSALALHAELAHLDRTATRGLSETRSYDVLTWSSRAIRTGGR